MDDPLMLDANAVSGDLMELFGFEMTSATHRCAHCGNVGAMALKSSKDRVVQTGMKNSSESHPESIWARRCSTTKSC